MAEGPKSGRTKTRCPAPCPDSLLNTKTQSHQAQVTAASEATVPAHAAHHVPHDLGSSNPCTGPRFWPGMPRGLAFQRLPEQGIWRPYTPRSVDAQARGLGLDAAGEGPGAGDG